MNEVKQELLELLQPYNSKEMIGGTYIKNKEKWFIHKLMWTTPSWSHIYTDIFWSITGSHLKLESYEILWPLSITALLKLINSTNSDFSKQYHIWTDYRSEKFWLLLMENDHSWKVEVNWCMYYEINFIAELPEKDLEEYTLQETKDVIVIIKELLW